MVVWRTAAGYISGYDLSGHGVIVAFQMLATMLQLCGRVIVSDITAMGYNGRQVLIGLVSLAILTIACAVLVLIIGLMGAALALCMSFALKFVLLLWWFVRIDV